MKRKIMKNLCLAALILAVIMVSAMAVSAQTPQKYDISREGILSGYYAVDPETGFITGIAPDTLASRLENVCVPAGAAASTYTVATGTTLQYGSAELTAIVTGDLNGDGSISISDMLMLKSAILGENLSATAATAGDINDDGQVTITDFLRVKSCLLGLESIAPVFGAKTENALLIETWDSQLWAEGVASGAASFISDNTALVTVDAQGVLHTEWREGSCFVYALDADGNILARQIVTVLEEPLAIYFSSGFASLAKGQTLTLDPWLNHPVTPTITWTSTNPGIVSVEQGVLTGVDYGEAVISARLDNGDTAYVNVKVMPPITDISFERSLYKVKPGASRSVPLVLTPADTAEELLWSSSDSSIASVGADGTVTGHAYGTVTITATGRYSGLSTSCNVKVCDAKQVAFTFDDGPAKHTERLLDFLKENDLRVTFFLVGNRISYYPNAVRRAVQEGHEVGYHSYSHTIQTTLTSEQIKAEFENSNQILKNLTGQGFTLWRSPGGGYNDRVLSSVPLPHIMWWVDSLDWKTRNATAVYNAIRSVSDGAIVLMHDLHSFTVDGAIRAMKEMNEGDYEFVTVTELLSRDGTPPENGVSYNRG